MPQPDLVPNPQPDRAWKVDGPSILLATMFVVRDADSSDLTLDQIKRAVLFTELLHNDANVRRLLAQVDDLCEQTTGIAGGRNRSIVNQIAKGGSAIERAARLWCAAWVMPDASAATLVDVIEGRVKVRLVDELDGLTESELIAVAGVGLTHPVPSPRTLFKVEDEVWGDASTPDASPGDFDVDDENDDADGVAPVATCIESDDLRIRLLKLVLDLEGEAIAEEGAVLSASECHHASVSHGRAVAYRLSADRIRAALG